MKLVDQDRLKEGVAFLCRNDADLGQVVSSFGLPPLWDRAPGFATLVHIILEQQVSIASALAAFRKLQSVIDPVDAQNFIMLDPVDLRQVGFSRQKAGYAHNLAALVINRQLDLDGLAELDDEKVREILISVRGIGRWTIDIYLLMALRRQDIWPGGDLALISALQGVKGLQKKPAIHEIEEITNSWKPWRSVAARILWHYYLSR
ncbi:MAG: DNA-3-methyladenine glycosylase 2 family protein [Calditrichales bacterium]|nr:MAG: DNA-3-methyladenine glycosylase 2 family protein [Calditrichales bacterium]